LAAEEDQPWVQSTGLLVEWRPDHSFEDDNDTDYVYTPEVDEEDYEVDIYEWNDVTEDELTVTTGNLSDND
jgi:hypothetical protein